MKGQSVRERSVPASSAVDPGRADLAVQKHLVDLLGRIGDALGVDTVAVLLLDESRQNLVARAAKGLEEEVERGITIPLGKGFAGRVVAEDRPIVIEDLEHADVVSPILREKGLRSLLGVPLAFEGMTLGVLHVGSLEPRSFTEEDIRRLELAAERVALPLAQARLFELEQEARSLADTGRSHLGFLAEASAVLSSSLDYETTLASVARLAVPGLADWCVIDLEESGVVRRVAVACADPANTDQAEKLRLHYAARPVRPEGTGKIMQTGSSELSTTVSDDYLQALATDEGELEILRTLGLRSNLLVPLVARGKTLGVLTLATAESGRIYLEDDLRLAEELAARAALAVDNARLYSEEQAARKRLSFLAEASAILASSLDYERTLQSVAQLSVPQLADWCVVDIADDDGELQRVALTHGDPEKVAWAEELGRRYPENPDAPQGVHATFRTGEPNVVPEIPESLLIEAAVDEEHLRLLRGMGMHSYMAVPLVARGRSLGVISFIAAESKHTYDDDDLALAQELARRAAIAVDNSRLFSDAVASEQQMRFLADAGTVLASSLDYDATLQAVARLAVPTFADWCIVDVLDGDEVRRVAVAAANEESQELLEELRDRYPPTGDSPQPAGRALREGRPVIFHEFSPESLKGTTRDEHHFELMQKLGVRSALAVPLVARGHTVGALTFAWSHSGKLYEERDVPLAEELAGRVALAVDNARLFREAEERAEAALALDRVGDGVFLLDGDEEVRLWNPAAEAITGLSRSLVLGNRAPDVVPGWAAIAERIPIAESPAAARRTETLPLEIEGRELWLSISGVALEDGTVYAFRDLTEERALEKLRSDFVATISHELRTPLASVYGAAMTLTRDDIELDEDRRRMLLDVIAGESERLARIVNDILLTSRIDSETLAFSIESCEPEQAVDEVLAATSAYVPEGLELRKVPGSSAPRIAADPEQLREVLDNLIDNAVKYGPGEGVVEVGLGRRGRWACFWVKDEGYGIPDGERGRIFEKFYRLDPDLLKGVGGTGLGLYIARELVQRMGGRIWVESEEGAGSTFFFELPLADVSGRSEATLCSQPG